GARRWIRFHLAKAGFLARAPWEALHDASGFLAVDNWTVISRSAARTRPAPAGGTGPLRVLVTISSPSDCVARDTKSEKQLIEDALGGLQLLGRVEVDVAPDGTIDTLRRLLRAAEGSGRPYGAWHFIGHGEFNARRGENELLMVGRDGNAQSIGAR